MHMKISRRFFLAAAGGATLGAALLFLSRFKPAEGGGVFCGEAPPLVYGREECPVCKMVVDYPPSSAAMRARVRGVERWYFFDDVGCMATWHREVVRQGGEVVEVCVRDRVDGRWLKAEKAIFLVTTEFTAMGTGIVVVAPDNVERYKRGEVRGPWAVWSVEGSQQYNPPAKTGEVKAEVTYKCVVEKFEYGPAWSVSPDWYRNC